MLPGAGDGPTLIPELLAMPLRAGVAKDTARHGLIHPLHRPVLASRVNIRLCLTWNNPAIFPRESVL